VESKGQLLLCVIWTMFLLSNKFYSVDAQWITAKKDWEESKRRHKLQQQKGFTDSSGGPEAGQATDEAVYDKDMDATRCILYFHGGEQLPFRGIIKINVTI
jgi:hypothetical protein